MHSLPPLPLWPITAGLPGGRGAGGWRTKDKKQVDVTPNPTPTHQCEGPLSLFLSQSQRASPVAFPVLNLGSTYRFKPLEDQKEETHCQFSGASCSGFPPHSDYRVLKCLLYSVQILQLPSVGKTSSNKQNFLHYNILF